MKPRPMRIAALMLGLLLALTVGAPAQQHPEVALRAAMELETVKGDLRAAIEEYKQIARGSDRALAAKALIRMAGCYQKLGNTESRTIYEQVVRDYADQNDAVTVARARLAALTEPVTPAAGTEMVVRRVWATYLDIEGNVSPNGRYLPLEDEFHNLVVRDLISGNNLRLTHNQVPKEQGDFHDADISPDNRWVAYSWHNPDGSRDLRVVGLDGSRRRVLYRHADVVRIRPFGWTPDGTQILARFRRADRTWQIAMVSVADGSVRVLKSVGWWDYPKMSLSRGCPYPCWI